MGCHFLPQKDIKIPRLFPNISPIFPDQSNIQKLRNVYISMTIS